MSDGTAGPADVLALAKAGDIKGAIGLGEDLMLHGLEDAGLATFTGVLCCRDGDLWRGITHLRRAVELAPNEALTRIELARALLSAGAHPEAEAIARPMATPATPIGREMQRILGRALLQDMRAREALDLFEPLNAADPGDFESWDGTGVARLALDDPSGAVAALERATSLRPGAVAYWVDLARAQVAARAYDAAAAAAQRALALAPGDGSAHVALARAELGRGDNAAALANLDRAKASAAATPELMVEIADVTFGAKAFAQAEDLYRLVLASRADLHRAWLGLGKLLERTNRHAELLDHCVAAELAGVPAESMALLKAQALRSAGRNEEALATVALAPEDDEPAARAQLIGDIADRMGDTDKAFEAFSTANRLLAEADSEGRANAEQFRESFRKLTELVTPDWHARWRPVPPFAGRAPMFIFGFPRSGTTLIDTMLSGHPDAVVLEEEPVIDNVAKALGPVERLDQLSDGDVAELRALYLAEVAKIVPDVGGRLIVDKNPLGLSSTPLLFRLFPEARFVFAERHPCDVVLSCFIMSSRLNANVASFYDFEGTARLYDRVLSFWQRCTQVLPFKLHTVRYETLIAAPESQLRALATFAGLSWDDRLLDHESSAAERTYIGSPSYAQVAQPIYTRARGRWLRYRGHMQGVIPILKPWIDALGYDLGED